MEIDELKIGERVYHANSRDSFKWGKVLEINRAIGVVLVQWEDHEVNRFAKRPGRTPLTPTESGVDVKSLRRSP